jgi:protein TonB
MSNDMRLVYFFVLSLALHATALVYPVSFGGQREFELVQVTILPIEQESLGGSVNSGGKKPAAQPSAKSVGRTHPATQSEVESKPSREPRPQVIAAEVPTASSDNALAFATATANFAEHHSSATSGSTTNGVHGTGVGGTGTGGTGSGTSGTASGGGDGNGSSENGIVLTQARYRDTPRPDYPDSARREGREGRVLLRVLVDDQGRSKQVAINSSSGSHALDRAAADAIQRWRFHPARQGDQPVESWLRIPIEFRLADAKPQ